MQRFKYELTAISSVIASPRSNLAFFPEIEGYKDKVDAKIIYPFYRYGDYQCYEPNQAEYYLPGSSVKGALKGGRDCKESFYVDDIMLKPEYIVLRNLYKVQNLNTEKDSVIKIFFPDIKVEMLKKDIKVQGDFYCKDMKMIEDIFLESNKLTKRKIENMITYLKEIIKKEKKQTLDVGNGLIEAIEEMKEKLEILFEKDNVHLIGGYKGLLHAIDGKYLEDEFKSAIYIDYEESGLPHGLVTLELE
jgi:hypothetical protein